VSYSTPEGKIKRKVIEVLKKHSVWYFFPANNGFGKAGIPDVIAIVKGHFFGIEVKADRAKKPTALQIKCGDEIRSAGGLWMVVCDNDSLDLLETIIKEYIYR
jgi:Holliday junction resolvase